MKVEGIWFNDKGKRLWYNAVVVEVETERKKGCEPGVLIGWVDGSGNIESQEFFPVDGLSKKLRVPEAKSSKAARLASSKRKLSDTAETSSKKRKVRRTLQKILLSSICMIFSGYLCSC
jgi:hypothetical protein